MLRLAYDLSKAAPAPGPEFVCASVHVGSRSRDWLDFETRRMPAGSTSRRALEGTLTLLRLLQDRHRQSATVPRTALAGLVAAVSKWGWSSHGLACKAQAPQGRAGTIRAAPASDSSLTGALSRGRAGSGGAAPAVRPNTQSERLRLSDLDPLALTGRGGSTDQQGAGGEKRRVRISADRPQPHSGGDLATRVSEYREV